MSAEDDLDLAVGQQTQQLAALCCRRRAGQQSPLHPGRIEQRPKRVGVLRCQYLRRCHHRGLSARVCSARQRLSRDEGLAGPDIAEQHPIHGAGLVHVAEYLGGRGDLVGGQFERDGRPHAAECGPIHRMGHAGPLTRERVAPKRHVELQLQDLVVREALARSRGFGDVVRELYRPQRAVQRS